MIMHLVFRLHSAVLIQSPLGGTPTETSFNLKAREGGRERERGRGTANKASRHIDVTMEEILQRPRLMLCLFPQGPRSRLLER